MSGPVAGPAAAAGQGWGEILGAGRLPLFALLCFGVWLNAADALVTATIMPSVAREVGGYRYFAWATAGLLAGGIAAGSSAGLLAGRLGLRRAMVIAALVYAAGCAASAAAPGIFPFLAGRVVQGVGGGWVAGLCFVAIGVLFPERLWARVFAAIAGVWGVATVLGPLVGGVFAGAGLWRWAFWGFAIQGLALVGATFVLLPDGAGERLEAGLPWRQLLLVLLAVGLTAAADVSGSAVQALLLVGAGLAMIGLLLRVDARASVRLLPRAAADLGSVTGAGYAMIVCLSAGAVVFSVYGAALLQAAYGLRPLGAGYVVGAEAVGWSGVAIVASRAPPAWRSRMILWGGAIIPVALAALALTLARAPLALVVAGAVALGAGFGVCFAFVTARIVSALGEDERGLGSSAVPTVQMTGNALGAAAAGAVANLLGLGGGITAASARHAAPVLFAVFVPLAVLGALAGRRVAASPEPDA